MALEEELRSALEREERRTVSDAFGGRKADGRTKSYSVAQIRDWLFSQESASSSSPLFDALVRARQLRPPNVPKIVVGNLIRFSFLIELTNLKVGSTKMKTRWVPGFILMSRPGSFEPVRRSFEPGNDPRAAPFEQCLGIFVRCLDMICTLCQRDNGVAHKLERLDKVSSVPYEVPLDYVDVNEDPVHIPDNVRWAFNNDIEWLLEARRLIKAVLPKSLLAKIETKTYKTDRALTGKDKTNRAKRWEVRADDFQHATLTECWSVERQLYVDLVRFEAFPPAVRQQFENTGLIERDGLTTRCPVTLEVLNFGRLGGNAVHGRADYQVGHLDPLKRGGNHRGDNVRWLSADGNRIQGDLTIGEARELLNGIMLRMQEAAGDSRG